ncbi:hypothetical protein EDB80DRAFT_399753 [Ilyonectria destructans]|nr:hypothetical protein EDB80DRAFT_399753 [Ilyonectria destructans]
MPNFDLCPCIRSPSTPLPGTHGIRGIGLCVGEGEGGLIVRHNSKGIPGHTHTSRISGCEFCLRIHNMGGILRIMDTELVAWCIISARDKRQTKQKSLLQPSEASSPANTNQPCKWVASPPGTRNKSPFSPRVRGSHVICTVILIGFGARESTDEVSATTISTYSVVGVWWCFPMVSSSVRSSILSSNCVVQSWPRSTRSGHATLKQLPGSCFTRPSQSMPSHGASQPVRS